MLNPADVIDFLDWLDNIDSVQIEENQNGNDVTLDGIKSYNSGNNCLHYILVHNNHRIVIQTYKDMNRKGNVDIVQGKPELEVTFDGALETMNLRPQDFTDDRINKLFVLYCGLWSKWVSTFYWGEMESFVVEFGPDMSLTYVDNNWYINVDDVPPSQVLQIFKFIEAVEEICYGRAVKRIY